MRATYKHYVSIVQSLVEKGANIDIQDAVIWHYFGNMMCS